MPDIAVTAYEMIANMAPVLRPGRFVFVTTDDHALVASLFEQAISIFNEDEGVSMIIPVALAEKFKLSADQPMCCMTLNVYSSLEGVGLISAVSSVLGDHAIPCNIVAAFHHDHVFVPSHMCDRAMQVLKLLQDQVVKGQSPTSGIM